MGQTVATNMIRRPKTSGDSDTRHSTTKPHSQWYKHYVTADAAINQNNSSSWIQDPSRPHLNVTLDKTHKIKALVDSGSTICLADSSILNHISNKSTNVTELSLRLITAPFSLRKSVPSISSEDRLLVTCILICLSFIG